MPLSRHDGDGGRRTALSARPLPSAIGSASLAIVVLVIEGLRLGKPIVVIALTALGFGALFGVLGWLYPRIAKFFWDNAPAGRQ